MRKRRWLLLLLACCAAGIGVWLWFRFSESPSQFRDVSHRVADRVIQLNGQELPSHSFAMKEMINISGEMKLLHSADYYPPNYTAYLIALDHPVKEIIANTGGAVGTIQGNVVTFAGQLATPPRAGSYELIICLFHAEGDTGVMRKVNDLLQTVGLPQVKKIKFRAFYRVPVTVRPEKLE